MVKFLVERPIAVLVSFFALLLLGASAFLYLPASLLPESDIPEINVTVNMPNSGSKKIEQSVIGPLRSNLMQLKGLEDIESRSMEGEGRIKLVFKQGTNISLAFIEVNEKVDLMMNRIPPDVQRPLVNKISVSDIPIFRLNVFPKDNNDSDTRFAELSSLSKEIIKRRLEQIPEISTVDMSGLSEPEVHVIPKEGYLQALGLSPEHLLQVFSENKISLGNILVKDGNYQYFLKFNSDVFTLKEIESTPLNIKGRLFKLGDLVNITFTHSPSTGAFYTHGKKAINFAILKQSSAKMDDLNTSFTRLLTILKLDYPDLEFEVANDQTELLDFSISNLQQDLVIGGILAFFLMLVFIRRIRPAFLIGITIPVSLVISMLGFYLLKINLNIISLGGLILGLAMIIDNSIVVIDTINRHKENEGSKDEEAAIQGTNEIIRPLITSVLTNCAVFIPLIFLSGLAGAIFYDQALSITIGVVSSLIVSILLLPPLYVLFYRSAKGKKERELPSLVNVTRWYEKGLDFVFKFPKSAILIVFLILISSIALFRILDKERLPPVSRADFEAYIDWNESIGHEENEKRVKFLLASIAEESLVQNAWVGQQQYLFLNDADLVYNQAKLYVRAKNKEIIEALKIKLATLFSETYTQSIINFQHGKNAFDAVFANEMAPLRIQIAASDKREMPPVETSMHLVEELSGRFPQAFVNPVALHEKIVLKVKTEQAALYNINISNINAELQSLLKPRFIDYYQGAQTLVPMVLVKEKGSSLNRLLSENFISNRSGVEIPLISLIDVHVTKEYQAITAGIAGEYYPIDMHTEQPAKDLKQLETKMKEHPDVNVMYTGSYFSNQALIKEMALIFLVSVLLLYFILAAQFESLIQPLFILVELPIALSGAFIFLYLGNNSLNLMSMIGIIVMTGLIINDSILKIDAINQLRREGVPLMDAIYEGGHKRLKPIIMITLTSVGALLPTLFMHDLGSELQKPLALALIGGMLVGMLVSLFFVPLIYWAVYKKKDFDKIK